MAHVGRNLWQRRSQEIDQGSIPFFNSIAEAYLAKYAESSPGGYAFRVRQEKVLELLFGVTGRVLDVGCGPGVMTQEVLKLGCEFWGVDGSPQMITECRKRFGEFPGAHFSVGDAMALPFPGGIFDVVICIGVLDRVVQPEMALTEMARVLRPGGTLLVSFANLLSPYALWRSHVFYPFVGYLKRVVSTIRARPLQPNICSPATLWTSGKVSRLMSNLVGEVKQIVYYNFNLLISPLDELFPSAALWLAQRLEPLRRSKVRWLGAGFLVKTQKRPRCP